MGFQEFRELLVKLDSLGRWMAEPVLTNWRIVLWCAAIGTAISAAVGLWRMHGNSSVY